METDLKPTYSVLGADAALTEDLKGVWEKYNDAKSVLQRLDRRIQEDETPHVNSQSLLAQSSTGQRKAMQTSKLSHSQRVGFKEPLVSYHERHDPTSLSNSLQVGQPHLGLATSSLRQPETPAITFSARDFSNADSLRVSLRNYNPNTESLPFQISSDRKPISQLMEEPGDLLGNVDSPKDRPADVRELNYDAYFEPSVKVAAPGRDLTRAGSARVVKNTSRTADYRPQPDRFMGLSTLDVGVGGNVSMESELSKTPHRRYDAVKQKKKLEENSEGLAKLKETIRRQKENRSPSSLQGSYSGRKVLHNDADPVAYPSEHQQSNKLLTRKIAAGPPAPKYLGFNTAKTRLRTPDGKVWREDGKKSTSHTRLRPENKPKAATGLFKSADTSNPSKAPAKKEKRTAKGKPIRKIGKIQSDNIVHKKSLITPSSWREGQKVAEAILGPMPKKKAPATTTQHSPPTKEKQRSVVKETEQDSEAVSCNNNNVSSVVPNAATNPMPNPAKEEANSLLSAPAEGLDAESLGNASNNADVFANEDRPEVLSVNVRGILDDLQSSSSSSDGSDSERGESKAKSPKKSSKTKLKRRPGTAKQTSPGKKEPIKKVRHYNQSQVQQYMAKQKADRRKRLADAKKQEQEANERRMKQLNELDQRQKEKRRKQLLSFSMQGNTEGRSGKSLQETFTKDPGSSFNSPRQNPVGDGYEARIASFLDKLDRYRSIKQNDSVDSEAQPKTTKVSDFMSKLDQYLNEDDSNSTSNRSPSPKQSPRTDGNLTVADLSGDYKSPKSAGYQHRGSPQQTTASPKLYGLMESEKVDRIAAIKAKSDLLQERIAQQAQQLIDRPSGVPMQSYSDLSHYNPYEKHLRSTAGLPGTSRHSSPSPSDKRYSPRPHTNLDDSFPGVANTRDHALNSARIQNENEASTKIQAAYKGHAVRHALETWELPSGKALLESTRHEEEDDNEEENPHSSRSNGSSLDPRDRSVHEIMEDLTRKEFCAGSSSRSTWADHMKEEDKQLFTDGTDFLQDLQSRLQPQLSSLDRDRRRKEEEERRREEERSKAPWERRDGDKYSIPNLFAHKYLKLQKSRKDYEEQDNGASYKPPPAASSVEDVNRARSVTPKADAPVPPLDFSVDEIPLRSSSLSASAINRAQPDKYDDDFNSTGNSSAPGSSRRNLSKSDVLDPLESALQVHSARSHHSSSSSSSRTQRSPSAGGLSNRSKSSERFQASSYDPKALITWSKSLRRDQGEDSAGQEVSDDSRMDASASPLPPVVNLPVASQGSSLRFSPAVLEHKLALEINRYETIDETMNQLTGTERTQAVTMAQQETVSIAQILQSRQLQHQMEVDRLTTRAKEEAMEASKKHQEEEARRMEKEIKEREEFVLKQGQMALKLQEETLKSLQAQQRKSSYPASSYKKHTTNDYTTTSSDKSYSSSSDSSKTPVTSRSYSTTFDSSLPHRHEDKRDESKRDRRSPPSIVSEHSTTSVRHSEGPEDSGSIQEMILGGGGRGRRADEDASSKSISEKLDFQLGHDDDTSRSISEEIDAAPSPKGAKKTKVSKRSSEGHDLSDVGSVTFDESVTEDEIAEISRRAIVPSESHRRLQRRKSPLTKSSKDKDHFDNSDISLSSDDTLPSQHIKGRYSSLDESFPNPTSLFGDSDIGSFSTFLNDTVQQYMLEQEMRARHQTVMLKLREKAIKEKTQAELAWLEQQKHNIRSKGEDDKMPPIKKKKRAILLRLQVETEEIKKLRAANKAAIQDRELILKQHKNISRIMQSTQQIKEKIKSSSGANKVADPKASVSGLSLSPEGHIVSSTPVPQSGDSPSISEDDVTANQSESDLNVSSNRLLRHLKVASRGLDDRKLTYREKGLLKRKRDAERLLEWKRKLDEEEQKVIDIEKKAISAWAQDAPKVAPEAKEKERTKKEDTPPHPASSSADRQSSVSPSESSIAEEVAVRSQTEEGSTTSSSTQDGQKPAGGGHDVSSEGTIGEEYTQSFDSSVQSSSTKQEDSKLRESSPSTPKTSSVKTDTAATAAKKPAKATSSSASPGPSTPLLGRKDPSSSTRGQGGGPRIGKKRDSIESWSDESFSQTQSETEQSDVECRVHALKEELKKRRMIADRLKKQQKKKHKEHLRAQEASLKNQIEAFDALIKKTQQELSQELDVTASGSNGAALGAQTPVAKPQIRSPRKSDARQARSLKYIPVPSPEASPRAGSQKVPVGAAPGAIMTKQCSDSDSSGRSSRSLSFDDEQQQTSPEDGSNGVKTPFHPLSLGPRQQEKTQHSSADSSPTTPGSYSPMQERPTKLEFSGPKTSPLNTSSITSPLYGPPKQGDKGVRSLIPKPSKLPQKTPVTPPSLSEETPKSAPASKSSIPVPVSVKSAEPEKPKVESPGTPPSSYSDDFDAPSIATDEDVSEQLSEASTDKSDASVPFLDLTIGPSLKLDADVTMNDDDDKTPMASPSTTPTPSAPQTPTPDVASQPMTMDTSPGIDVMDGTTTFFDDVISRKSIHAEPLPGNKDLAERITSDILQELVEDSMNLALKTRLANRTRHQDVTSEESKRRKIAETPGAAPTSPDPGSTKRPRRSEGEPPKLTSSARNLLQLLTDAPPPTSPERDVTAADDITSNLLSDTLDEVLEIRKQRARKWAEESTLTSASQGQGQGRDLDNGREVESIMQLDGRARNEARRGGERRTGLESEDVDREPTVVRPVSPVFGSSQDDISEEWIDDDMYPSFQGKKRDDSPNATPHDDWYPEEMIIGPPPIKLAVPSKRDDVMNIINQAIDFYYDKQPPGAILDSGEVPARFLEEGGIEIEADQPESAKSASPVFRKCLFDLVRELMNDAYGGAPDVTMSGGKRSPWMKARRRKRPAFCRSLPQTKQELVSAVSEEVSKLFNFSNVRRKLDPRSALKWGTMKKKDNVDLLLIDELREEEPEWTDYDLDERTVKMQLADNLLDFLLADTVQCFNRIGEARAAREVAP